MTERSAAERVNEEAGAEVPALAGGEEHCDGVVCFAGIDWWYHNRGHSECQIMTRLADRVPVLWVNSIGMRAPLPGKTRMPFHRYARKLKSTLKGLQRDESGLWIYSPLFLPRYSPRALAINGLALDLQVRLLCRWLGIAKPSVWATVPTVAPALERGHYVRCLFNRSDDFATFPEVDGDAIRALEDRLLERADDVAYVNRILFERERGRARRSHFIGHGVDFDHFARRPIGAERPPAPERIRDLPRPIVGFYGGLRDYTVDLELMVETAKRIRPATLLVIGPHQMELDALLAQPNVCYLGPIEYAELPTYAEHFDVGIMPWLQNDWIEACNPIKLKEYLAAGFPIVAMRFPELAPYDDWVHAADSREEFLDCVERALAERGGALAERRRASVSDSSWDRLADEVGELLRLPPEPGP